MKLNLHVDTTLFHCTAILRSDTTLKQNKKISNFISSFWHCEFILTCQTLFHLWSAPWISSEYSHPDCLCTQYISLFRVENTSFRIVAWGIRCYSSPRKRRRSAIVLCSVILFWTALPRTSHTCSIQLRSGDIAGHSKRLTLLACRNPSTILARWGLALSSWKMPLLPTGRRKGTTWGHKISSM